MQSCQFAFSIQNRLNKFFYLLNPLKALYFQGVSPVLCANLMYFPLFLPLQAETRESVHPNTNLLFRQVTSPRRLRAKSPPRTNLQFVLSIFRSLRKTSDNQLSLWRLLIS